MHWLLQVGRGLRHPDVVNFMDKLDVQIYLTLVGVRLLRGDDVGVEAWLREAIRSARKFDAHPQYRTAHGMKFYHSSEKSLSYDDMGESGMAMIEGFMVDHEDEAKLRGIWERVCGEA